MIIQLDLYKNIKPYLYTSEAITITGMRRAGKTTLLRFISQQIHSSNQLFLDLEDPINQKYFEELSYEKIKLKFETEGLDFNQPHYIFLDEIQLVKNIPQCVKYFIDHYQTKFFLTGSASFYLKNLFSESLSGRQFIFELYPCTFSEFLRFKQVKIVIPQQHQQIDKVIFEIIDKYYQEYLTFGGFPQVILAESTERKQKLLENIFTSYYQLEIKGLSGFRKVKEMRDLILLLLSRAGQKIDVKKVAGEIGVGWETASQYLSFLEETYFIAHIKPFSRNKGVEMRKMPKIYICDCGLANHLGKINPSFLFEQAVFQNLKTQGAVNYYQRKNGAEIDFIFNKKEAYEVKLNATQVDINKVKRLSKELGLSDAKIISWKYSKLDDVIYGFELRERRKPDELPEQVITESLERAREPKVEIRYSQEDRPDTVGGAGIVLDGKTALIF